MSIRTGQALVAVSCVTLLHAAFSTYEHLSALKSLSGTSKPLPLSIIVEALLALILFLPGTTLASSRLEDVTYRGEMARRTIDDSDASMGYMRLSERGRALFGDGVGVEEGVTEKR